MIRSAIAVCALAATALGPSACSAPEPQASQQAIDSLARDQTYVDGDAHSGTVSYLHAGEPRVARVVFVHGSPGAAAAWADFLLGVPDGQEYVAPDRPGFGESRPDDAVVSLPAQAAALAPFLEAGAGTPVVLVGHDLGAAIAAEAALRYPGRVAGLVLVAGSLVPDRGDPHWTRVAAGHAPISWILPRALANANREHLARTEQLGELIPRLARIRQPVSIVHGARDEQVPYSSIAALRRRLAAAPARVTRLENGGHDLPWSSRSIVQAQINTLIAGICGGLETCRGGDAGGD